MTVRSIPARSVDLRREVGGRIREWRLRRNLSQTTVARAAGITQASLSNYETGKRDLPLSTFLGVVAALDVSAGDLLDVSELVDRTRLGARQGRRKADRASRASRAARCGERDRGSLVAGIAKVHTAARRWLYASPARRSLVRGSGRYTTSPW